MTGPTKRPEPPRERRADRAWYRYADRLLPTPARAGRWIDMGCGRGEFIALAGEDGHSGVGLDRRIDSVRGLTEAGIPVLAADLARGLPFDDATLDGVTLIEVIEHIVNAEDLLRELARVIRPGGWFILTTPNVAHLTYRVRAVTGHPPKQEGYHYRFFTRKKLADAVTAAGFVLEDTASFGKSLVLSRLGRLAGRGGRFKARYRVPSRLEPLFAQHFVWRLRREPSGRRSRPTRPPTES